MHCFRKLKGKQCIELLWMFDLAINVQVWSEMIWFTENFDPACSLVIIKEYVNQKRINGMLAVLCRLEAGFNHSEGRLQVGIQIFKEKGKSSTSLGWREVLFQLFFFSSIWRLPLQFRHCCYKKDIWICCRNSTDH